MSVLTANRKASSSIHSINSYIVFPTYSLQKAIYLHMIAITVLASPFIELVELNSKIIILYKLNVSMHFSNTMKKDVLVTYFKTVFLNNTVVNSKRKMFVNSIMLR